MKTVRYIVRQQMKAKEMSVYALAKAVRGKVSRQTVYNFVMHGSEMNSKSLAFVLNALGLEIRPKEKP